jgi:hypothetical protein
VDLAIMETRELVGVAGMPSAGVAGAAKVLRASGSAAMKAGAIAVVTWLAGGWTAGARWRADDALRELQSGKNRWRRGCGATRVVGVVRCAAGRAWSRLSGSETGGKLRPARCDSRPPRYLHGVSGPRGIAGTAVPGTAVP